MERGLGGYGFHHSDLGVEWATGVRRSTTGRPFQAVGPATEKARRCRITVRVRGTSNSAWAEERNEIRR